MQTLPTNGPIDDQGVSISFVSSFAYLLLAEGDTLVFVDAPSLNRETLRGSRCRAIDGESHSFRVHSEKLLALADSKFASLIADEDYQARVRTERTAAGHTMGKDIKFLLDLTPALEGEDSVALVEELSLTPRIVKWCRDNDLRSLPEELVGGHDDIWTCSCTKSPAMADDKATESEPQPHAPGVPPHMKKEDKGSRPGTPPPYYQLQDYCPVRHSNSIVHLLMMIEGKSSRLNSAARVWTIARLSRIFNCPSVVRAEVEEWISVNHGFAKVLPEETLSIGFALELPQATQKAFRILVIETALSVASTRRSHNPRCSIFGRRLGDVGDEDIRGRIQQASWAIISRIRLRYGDVSDQGQLDNGLEDRRNLTLSGHHRTKGPTRQHNLDKARRWLRNLQNSHLIKLDPPTREPALLGDNASSPDLAAEPGDWLDGDRATYVAPGDFERLEDILSSFNRIQKLLLPVYYNELGLTSAARFFVSPRREPRRGSAVPRSLPGDSNPEPCELNDQRAPDDNLDSDTFCRHIVETPYRQRTYVSTDNGSSRTISRPSVDYVMFRKDANSSASLPGSWRDTLVTSGSDMLPSLTDNEIRFLPTWAGGSNEGTGAVLESLVPPEDSDLSGSTRLSYHTSCSVYPVAPSLDGLMLDAAIAMDIRDPAAAMQELG